MTLVWKFVKSGYAVVAMGARRGGDQWRCYETRWPPEEWQELPGVRCPPLITLVAPKPSQQCVIK